MSLITPGSMGRPAVNGDISSLNRTNRQRGAAMHRATRLESVLLNGASTVRDLRFGASYRVATLECL